MLPSPSHPYMNRRSPHSRGHETWHGEAPFDLQFVVQRVPIVTKTQLIVIFDKNLDWWELHRTWRSQ